MKKICLTVFLLSSLLAMGCADSKRPILIALSLTGTQSIDEGQSFNLKATLTHDSQSKGVTWSLNGGGTLSAQTTTSVTYSAPSVAAAKSNQTHAEAAASSSSATITATSVAETKITAALSVTVNPPPGIGTPVLPDAVVGIAYSQTVTGAGGSGALAYALASGALPAGLNLNSSSGAISGTPSGAAGTSTFAIKVTDASMAGPLTATTGNITIKVNLPAGPSISTSSLPAGTVGLAYNQTVSASGGVAPLSYAISVSTLPAGLGIGASNGVISGTPTTAGNSTFTVKVTDSSAPTGQTATKQFTIAINPALAITTTSLLNGTVGTAYSGQVTETGGVGSLSWTLMNSSLPAGLSLDMNTGAISGTPTAAGTTNFAVQVVDSSTPHQSATKGLSITINAAAAGLCDPSNTGSEFLLRGQYAMILQGFNSVGTVVYGATFDADGEGHIGKTVGILDTNNNNGGAGPLDVAIDSTQSSYTIGSDHRGCLKIVTASGTLPFRFSVSTVVGGVATKGHVVETQAGGFEYGSGTLALQDSSAFLTSQLTGKYAFGIAAKKSNGEKYGAVGVFDLNGSGGLSGQIDSNEGSILNGNGSTFPANAGTFSSGSYSVGSNGRGTLDFTVTGGSKQTAVFYVVSSSSFVLLSSGVQSASPLFEGSATLQTGGPFSNSSINAISVFGTSGLGQTVNPSTVVRLGRLLPGTTPSLSYIENSNGVFSTPSVSFTYAVDSAGRSVFQEASAGKFAVAYLSAPNQGYLLFMIDPISGVADRTVSFGQFWPQTGAPFSDPALGGNWSFGSNGADSNSSNHRIGWAQFTASGTAGKDTISGAEDFALGTGSTILNQSYSFTLFYTSSNGVLDWRDNNLTQIRLGFLISPTTAIAIDQEALNTTPTLLYYETQ